MTDQPVRETARLQDAPEAISTATWERETSFSILLVIYSNCIRPKVYIGPNPDMNRRASLLIKMVHIMLYLLTLKMAAVDGKRVDGFSGPGWSRLTWAHTLSMASLSKYNIIDMGIRLLKLNFMGSLQIWWQQSTTQSAFWCQWWYKYGFSGPDWSRLTLVPTCQHCTDNSSSWQKCVWILVAL